jgi:endonuclease G
MAKFRKNHLRQEQAATGSFTKFGIFGVVLAMLFFVFNKFSGRAESSDEEINSTEIPIELEPSPNSAHSASTVPDKMLPSLNLGVLIKHEYYAISYSEAHEQAEWVAYELTRDRLNNNISQRSNNFRPDPEIATGSADLYDYKNSGYDRGHMVPAGDMAFSNRSMSETFYMSNMSPQVRNFNGGIWRELEENIRDWGRRFKHLYIVSGPILTDRLTKKIGDNGVSVPKRYFKVILDVSEPELKGIGFIMPNEVSYESIDHYVVSIDEVEAQTGIDFFHKLLDEEMEAELESQNNPELWRYSQKRFQLRVENWNKR